MILRLALFKANRIILCNFSVHLSLLKPRRASAGDSGEGAGGAGEFGYYSLIQVLGDNGHLWDCH